MADMEQLRALDEEHFEAGAFFDEAYETAREAHIDEYEAGKRREAAYRETFADGIVIERVVKPAKLSYLAGYSEQWAVSPPDPDYAVWLHLDESHARSLEGSFGANAYPSFWDNDYARRLTERPRPQEGLHVRFDVAGQHSNDKDSRRIYTAEEQVTHYEGLLEAIEWRLPTPEEVQKYSAKIALANA